MSIKFNRFYKMAKDEFGVTVTPKKSNGETFESLFGETTDIIIDREKQIEEIAKVICGSCPDNKECMHCLCADWYKAESLYNAGYRKQSEVAREIFEEIDKMLMNQECITENQRCKEVGDWIFHDYLPRRISELKKKYMEESGNVR